MLTDSEDLRKLDEYMEMRDRDQDRIVGRIKVVWWERSGRCCDCADTAGDEDRKAARRKKGLF